MWSLALIRSLSIMLLGIAVYSILLWVIGLRIPGRPRKNHRQDDSNYRNRRAWIVLGYYIPLAILIILVFTIIKFMVRGDL